MTTTEKKISIMFKHYNQKIKDIWDNYNFNMQYLPIIHKSVKENKLPQFNVIGLSENERVHTKEKTVTFGIVYRLQLNNVPYQALVEGVALTEDYIKNIAEIVYKEFPGRILVTDNGDEKEEKYMSIILTSIDRDEILDRIIEEKLRSIFYGNPADIFLKDKCKLEFGNYFKDHYLNLIKTYIEVLSMRNIIIHNDARIDRKYIRENKGSTKKLGEKVKLDHIYIRDSFILMRGLCAITSQLVQEKIYKVDNKKTIIYHYYKIFEDKFKK